MDISTSKIAIATHELVYGAPQALKDYLLLHRVNELIFIAHPLNFAESQESYTEQYTKGTLSKISKCKLVSKPAVLGYFFQIGYNFFSIIRNARNLDLFVGVDPLNALVGIWLKRFGLTKKTIYYTIDFVPTRFQNKFLNAIYHGLDKYCVSLADETWNVSPRIAEGREKTQGMDPRIFSRQKVVQIGVWFERVKRLPFEKIKQNQVLFLGNLLEKQGVQLVLRAIPDIVKSLPGFRFLIVGDGDYRPSLEKLVGELQIQQYVTFTGWVKDRTVLDGMLADSAIALALYDRDKDGFTYYADPTKLKDYLSAGLPILLTDVPHNAYEIERRKCGVIVNYDKEILVQAIIGLLQDPQRLKTYRTNAVQFASTFDWNRVFGEALCINN